MTAEGIEQTIIESLQAHLPGYHIDTNKLPDGTLIALVKIHRGSRLVRHYVAFLADEDMQNWETRSREILSVIRETRKAMGRLGRAPKMRFNVFPRQRHRRMRGK